MCELFLQLCTELRAILAVRWSYLINKSKFGDCKELPAGGRDADDQIFLAFMPVLQLLMILFYKQSMLTSKICKFVDVKHKKINTRNFLRINVSLAQWTLGIEPTSSA